MSIIETQTPSVVTSSREAAPTQISSELHASIVSELLDLMRRHTKQAGEDWNEATTLEDIGVDSFDLVELIFEVEDKYDIGINFNANTTTETLLTAGDVARVIEAEVAKKEGGRVISPVVTGAGIASAAGLDLESYWQSLVSCTDVFSDYAKRPGSGIRIAGIDEAGRFDDLPIAIPAMCDRSTFLAVFAARQALKEAGLRTPFDNPTRVAVVIGNGGGGLDTLEQQYDRFYKHGKRPHPFSVVRVMVSASASWLSMAFGAQGPCFVMSSACASATQAIGTAASLLKSGLADVAIAGGTEAALTEGNVLAWDAMKVMSRNRCRPFSRTRDGMMLSEGAGMLILETPEHARRRGVAAQVAVSGFASNSDAADIVSPSSDGMLRVMKAALDDANLNPQQVSYINAHGTGTASNDIAEVKALKELFGSGRVPPTSSIKGVTGHSLGAAGALEAVATVLAIRKSIAPPTANFEEVDPECDIDVIPNQARSIPIDVALSNSFAFGGLNAALVFQRVN